MHPDLVTGMSLFRVQYHPNFPTKNWHAGHANSNDFRFIFFLFEIHHFNNTWLRLEYLRLDPPGLKISHFFYRRKCSKTLFKQATTSKQQQAKSDFRTSKVRMHPDLVTGMSLFRVQYNPHFPTKTWHAGHAIRIHLKIKISRLRTNPDPVTGMSLFRVQ